MSEDAEKRAKRIDKYKRIIVALVAVLLVLPSIICIAMLVRQNSLQKQLEILSEEVARLRMQDLSEVGRISENRLVDLQLYCDDLDVKDPFGVNIRVADEPDLEDVVWEFAAEGTNIHKVYLTFDDGPSVYTDTILDTLNEYGVNATFFVVGHEDKVSKDLYKRIVEDGNTLGMHSFSHVYSKIYSSPESFIQDYESLRRVLVDATGVEPVFYRFPGGSSNTVSKIDMHTYIKILDEKGVTYFDWNVSSGDASGDYLSVDQIVSNSISGIEEREETVILLHDTGAKYNTVLALPKIIEAIQAMDNTVILPITADTEPVQHIQ